MECGTRSTMSSLATPPPRPPPVAAAFLVWGLGAALYLIGYFQRVAPAVIVNELSLEFALTAASLGNLSAIYFYSYVAMQIPTGLLVDHWGPRRVLTVGAALAAAGTALFAAAQDYPWVALGRFIVGAAVGMAFVAMLKLATHWFHPSRFAMTTGFALTAGVVGAVCAGPPLRFAVDAFGWRPVMGAAAAVTTALALATWLAVRDDPRDKGYASFMPQAHAARHSVLGGMREVLRARNVWLIFIVNGGITAPMLTFAGLWGVPFLASHYDLTTPQAAALTSMMMVSWAIAGPLAGALSDRMRARKPLLITGAVLATVSWLVVFLIPQLPMAVLIAALAFAGMASAVVMVGFACAKESAPAALAGSTVGVINMGNMLGGMLMQPAVGWVLDRYWSGAVENGVRMYSFEAYRAGFSLMLVWLLLAVIAAVVTSETHCRQTR